MDRDRWRQIEQLYHAALERAPNERAAFLAETCAEDSGLRREVEELLRYDGVGESFLEESALAMEARQLEPEELSQTEPQLLPGQHIGAYKILALLGRGGMGVVYRARDERLRRDVAIKVLPASLAHDADRLLRFRQEAQATSALNHPKSSVVDTDAPTQKRLTDPGVVMGTVGYMSPEQVRGQETDHRSDLFAFGVILYEMLSGQRAFRGASAIEVMNAILKEEPPELGETNTKISPLTVVVNWAAGMKK
jgi:serine/threonine protein kinase